MWRENPGAVVLLRESRTQHVVDAVNASTACRYFFHRHPHWPPISVFLAKKKKWGVFAVKLDTQFFDFFVLKKMRDF
jgi:hypothetical protein